MLFPPPHDVVAPFGQSGILCGHFVGGVDRFVRGGPPFLQPKQVGPREVGCREHVELAGRGRQLFRPVEMGFGVVQASQLQGSTRLLDDEARHERIVRFTRGLDEGEGLRRVGLDQGRVPVQQLEVGEVEQQRTSVAL